MFYNNGLNKQEVITIIGSNLKEIRASQGKSQKQVAAILGVSFQQVQKYERGCDRLSVDKLFVLKHYFDVSYEDFFMHLPTSANI